MHGIQKWYCGVILKIRLCIFFQLTLSVSRLICISRHILALILRMWGKVIEFDPTVEMLRSKNIKYKQKGPEFLFYFILSLNSFFFHFF